MFLKLDSNIFVMYRVIDAFFSFFLIIFFHLLNVCPISAYEHKTNKQTNKLTLINKINDSQKFTPIINHLSINFNTYFQKQMYIFLQHSIIFIKIAYQFLGNFKKHNYLTNHSLYAHKFIRT